MNLKDGIDFINNVEDLSAMPSLALDVMAMLNDSRSSLNDIVGKLQLDQAMVSYVLKTCNSPLYGIRNEVTSISMAVNLLGYSNIKSILMAYFLKNLYRLSGRNELRESLWKHSISVAVFSKLIAKFNLLLEMEVAYLAGLLHDIGKIVLYMNDSESYEKVIQLVQAGKDDFISAEKRLLDYSHVEVGYFLLEKWKFSEMLKQVILNHHDPQHFMDNNKAIRIVAFANQLAHVYYEGQTEDFGPMMKIFRFSEDKLKQLVDEAIKIIEDYFSIL